MLDFIINCIIWVCALYGFLDIIKNLIYIRACNKIKTTGIHMIIATKNQENTIEGFLRSLNFKILCNNENLVDNVILLDLNSNDSTKHIIEKFAFEHENFKVINWDEFEELFKPTPNKSIKNRYFKFN